MSRTWSLMLAWALGSSLSAASSPAGAEEPAGARAQLSCRPEAAPGRVLCELRVSALPGARLNWADALVTAAPPFVRPLRARVSPERFAGASAAERKLSLAFVASENGVGMVTVRSRAVVCRGQGEAERCRPEQHDVQAEVRVGS